MATSIIPGQTTWYLERDDEGHRTYTIIHRVEGLSTDGPHTVLQTTGLPQIGDVWNFDGDLDAAAVCKPGGTKVTPDVTEEPNTHWHVEHKFDTKPTTHCYVYAGTGSPTGEEIGNPLLEPQKISGTFTKRREEALFDRYRNLINNSAFEQIRGPSVEFDKSYPTVRIEQNVADLELALLADLIDKVNDRSMWGLLPRCLKLSNVAWEKKYYGQCEIYFTRVLEFDVDFETFDRYIIDEGTKVLRGQWDTDNTSPTYGQYVVADDEDGPFGKVDPSDPKNYIRFQDFVGNLSRVILNGAGVPYDSNNTTATTDDDEPGMIFVQKYEEGNFFLLGVPSSLES